MTARLNRLVHSWLAKDSLMLHHPLEHEDSSSFDESYRDHNILAPVKLVVDYLWVAQK